MIVVRQVLVYCMEWGAVSAGVLSVMLCWANGTAFPRCDIVSVFYSIFSFSKLLWIMCGWWQEVT